MLANFIHYIQQQQLFLPNQKILLAISGGIDSVVLAHLFQQAKYDFAIAHCNFGLRAQESDADAAFVKKLAHHYQVSFYEKNFDTPQLAKENDLSIQMLARQLRYHWFAEILQQEQFAYVATAHHQNDSLETLLLNLVKGTGIAGLQGIAAKNSIVIRPLLFATREEIKSYALANNLTWREDGSNASNKYQRNFLRNEVIPLLKNINPNLDNTFQLTLERLKGAANIFNNTVAEITKKVVSNQNDAIYINLKILLQEKEALLLLYEIVKIYNFSYIQTKQLYVNLTKQAGKTFISSTHILVKDRDQLVITPQTLQKDNNTEEIIHISQNLWQNEDFILEFKVEKFENINLLDKNPAIAYLDYDQLKFPLKIRKWTNGDYFYPLGMQQKKKLSDFIINSKIPLNLKERIWVLTSEEKIVWVINHRIDDRFKITTNTKNLLKITFKNRIT